MSAWEPQQVKMFAKDIAERYGSAWSLLGHEIRNALISHHVLMTMFSQRDRQIHVDDVRELRIAIEERLSKHHNMKALP